MKIKENASVFIFAMLGGILRYVISSRLLAWGTLLVNLAGCFMLAFLTYYLLQKSNFPAWLQTGLGTGMIGALTTFSTFAFETSQFMQAGQLMLGLSYWLLNSLGGLLLAWLGYLSAKKVAV